MKLESLNPLIPLAQPILEDTSSITGRGLNKFLAVADSAVSFLEAGGAVALTVIAANESTTGLAIPEYVAAGMITGFAVSVGHLAVKHLQASRSADLFEAE